MRFSSTNQKAPFVTFQEALLKGQAPDLGLYIPEHFPSLSAAQIAEWKTASYAEIAYAMLASFLHEEVDAQALESICKEAYDFPVPIETISDNRYIMRLDQGPTASFKDFAARAMARLMSYFLQQQERELLILTATSGDTGSAIAHAFHNVANVRVVILFPEAEVSDRQRKQMTTLGGNIDVVAVHGKFDDCQAMVKRAFADPALAALPLSSANSINIGRLLPQSVYYAYAYSRLVEDSGEIIFSIPCGNFGNMMGAMFAWRMGLPLKRLIVSVNENDEVPRFLETGTYTKIEPSRNCLSNAMNVGHPSNFARLVHLYDGQIDQTGAMQVMPDLERMRSELFSRSVTDQETRETIVRAYKENQLLLEPHGAVGWLGIEHYRSQHPEDANIPTVSIETAHPAKFPNAIEELLGVTPEVPPAISSIENNMENFDRMQNTYKDFTDYLQTKFG